MNFHNFFFCGEHALIVCIDLAELNTFTYV